MKQIQTIAVLGSGNGAHAVSAYLALKGLEVRLFELPQFFKNLTGVAESKEILLEGEAHYTGTGRLAMVTSDIAKAVTGADCILLPLPAFTHKVYAELLAPHVQSGQLIVLLPGTLGTLLFQNTFKKLGAAEGVLFAESNSLPFDARLAGPGKVFSYGMNEPLQLGVFPAKYTDEVLEEVGKLFCFTAAVDVVDCGLNSLNPIVHTPGCILNAGRIERSRGEFWLYEEGITHCVARVMESMDAERLRLLDALGYPQHSVAESLAFGREPRTIWEEIHSSIHLTPIKGPTSVKNRYFTEDIPYGLVPWSRLGDALGVDTPIIDGFIHIGSPIIEQDAWEIGPTLEDFGIAGLKPSQLLCFLQDGILP